MNEKRESITYLTEGPVPAKSPIYYMDYLDEKGNKKSTVLKFRYNGVRGVFVTSDARTQDYLDQHAHYTVEGKLSRHITANLTHTADTPKVDAQRTGVLTAMAASETEKRGPGRPRTTAPEIK